MNTLSSSRAAEASCRLEAESPVSEKTCSIDPQGFGQRHLHQLPPLQQEQQRTEMSNDGSRTDISHPPQGATAKSAADKVLKKL